MWKTSNCKLVSVCLSLLFLFRRTFSLPQKTKLERWPSSTTVTSRRRCAADLWGSVTPWATRPSRWTSLLLPESLKKSSILDSFISSGVSVEITKSCWSFYSCSVYLQFVFVLMPFLCVVQCGSSRVVYIGQIPSSKYSDANILKLAEPYGKVKKYFLNRLKREVENQSQY